MSDYGSVEEAVADHELELIKKLVDDGVLDAEEEGTDVYRVWPVLQPDKVPAWLKQTYDTFGEIRWFRQIEEAPTV